MHTVCFCFCCVTVGLTSGSVVKPAAKGVDLEAVGNINGVPVYEFDLDSLKVEDKPWRKPGTFPSQIDVT